MIKKKSTIHSYLTFNGNCRQAMMFYQKCFGGTLTFQTVGESPQSDEFPARVKKFVLTGALQNGSLHLVGTDMVGEEGIIKGNAVSLLLTCKNEKEIKELYKKLSARGLPLQPVVKNGFGIIMGSLKDRYGHQWVLQVKTPRFEGKV